MAAAGSESVESIKDIKETWPKNYDQTAEDYDDSIKRREYKAAPVVAEAIANKISDNARPKAQVIDIAAGTGVLGVELYSRGFRNIDALEPSQAMFDKAKEKNVYSEFICDIIDEHQTKIPSGYYDVVGITGGFGPGLIPVIGLTELVRIARKGGWIVFAMRKEFLENETEYKGRLVPRLETMQTDGIISFTMQEFPNYILQRNGVLFVIQKL